MIYTMTMLLNTVIKIDKKKAKEATQSLVMAPSTVKTGIHRV